MKKNISRKRIFHAAMLVCMILISVLALLPVALMFLDSFKTGSEIARNSWGFPLSTQYSRY